MKTTYIVGALLLLGLLALGGYFLFRGDKMDKCPEDEVEELDLQKGQIIAFLEGQQWKKDGFMLTKLYRVMEDGEMMDYSRADAILALGQPGDSSWYFVFRRKDGDKKSDEQYCALFHGKSAGEVPGEDPEAVLRRMKSGKEYDEDKKKKYKYAFWAQIAMSALILILALYLAFRKK